MNETMRRFHLAALLSCVVGCDAPGIVGELRDGGSDAARAVPACEPTASGAARTLGEPCAGSADCQDGCFCNGLEVCDEGVCAAGAEPCRDDVACTDTACFEELGRCGVTLRDELCADEDPCNGRERCEPEVGCVPGPRTACNDFLPCTVDRCEPSVGCVFEVRDLDGDGHAAMACGGDDCDDDPRTGASVGPAALELCGNGADDDCDGLFDYADPSCVPDNDDCASARELPGPGTYAGSTRALGFDVDVSCAPDIGPDAVFWFRLDAPSDVVVGVDTSEPDYGGGQYVVLSPRAACGVGPDVACMTAYESLVTVHHALPAGEYTVVVKTAIAQDFALTLDIGPASSPASFDTCGAGAPDVSAGGVFRGAFAGTADDYALPCAADDGQTEVAFRLELDAPREVSLLARTFLPVEPGATSFTIPFRPRLAIVRDCEMPTAGLVACDPGAPFDDRTIDTNLRVRMLDAGSYWVLLERPASPPGMPPHLSWELAVAVRDPSTPSPTDRCAAGTTTVTASTSLTGRFDETADDYVLDCHPGTFADAAVRLVLDRDADVLIDAHANPVGNDAYVALVRDCGDAASTLACAAGYRFGFVPTARILRRPLPAGTYFVLVEAERPEYPISSGAGPVMWNLSIEIADPVTPALRGDGCGDPMPLATLTSTTVPASPAQRLDVTSCGRERLYGESAVLGSPAVDDVYALTLDATSDVRIDVVVSGEEGYSLALQESCGDDSSMRRCEHRLEAGASETMFRSVPAGTQYFVVRHLLGTSSSARFVTSPPRPIPTNDTCASASTVDPAHPIAETTTTDDAALDYAPSCADTIAPVLWHIGDLVYEVIVPPGPPQRVIVDASFPAPNGFLALALYEGGCGAWRERACVDNGTFGELRPEGAHLETTLGEGTYHVVVQGSNTFNGYPDVDVSIEVTP
jgi:hypothetical protein